MKLIIDIPEEVKQTFDNAQNEDLYGNYYDRNSLIGKAIQNGIPLDKIETEIEQLRNDFMKQGGIYEHSAYGLDDALVIIGKIRNEVSS